MAQFIGFARTNYVTVDADIAQQFADCWNMKIIKNIDGKIGFIPSDSTDDGCFQENGENDNGDETRLDWQDLTEHLPDGEVLIVVTVGAEKLRRLVGYSEAWSNQGLEGSIDIDHSLFALLEGKFSDYTMPWS